MDIKIDYLSFSVMRDPRGAGDAGKVADAVVGFLADVHPVFTGRFADSLTWEFGGARGHYSASFYNPATFTTIRFGGTANHILVELPGTACQWLRDHDLLEQVVAEAAARVTRIDLAADIVTSSSPADFVDAGYNARFNSHAEIVSASGETRYVGSMKSERYARVYKYAPPHPRAGTLRVEHVLRSDYAKAAAAAMAGGGALHLAALCGNSWGWKSELWQPGAATDGKLRAARCDRHEPGRVRWLHQVCLPALVKADRDGLLDLREVCASLLLLRNAPGADLA